MTKFLISGISAITFLYWNSQFLSFYANWIDYVLILVPVYGFSISGYLYLTEKNKLAGLIGLISTGFITKSVIYALFAISTWWNNAAFWQLFIICVLPFLGVILLYIINIKNVLDPSNSTFEILNIENLKLKPIIGIIPILLSTLLALLIF